MSAPADPRERYPAALRHSTRQSGLIYQRSTRLFARFRHAPRDAGAGTPAGPQDRPVRGAVEQAAELEWSLQADEGLVIDVHRGTIDATATGIGAVYAEPASGRVVVPTGRVLVRFAEPVAAQARRGALHAAGYRIVSVPDYAPHCAWVESESGDPAQSLHGIDRLEALADVENVEPQWLSPRAAK